MSQINFSLAKTYFFLLLIFKFEYPRQNRSEIVKLKVRMIALSLSAVLRNCGSWSWATFTSPAYMNSRIAVKCLKKNIHSCKLYIVQIILSHSGKFKFFYPISFFILYSHIFNKISPSFEGAIGSISFFYRLVNYLERYILQNDDRVLSRVFFEQSLGYASSYFKHISMAKGGLIVPTEQA